MTWHIYDITTDPKCRPDVTLLHASTGTPSRSGMSLATSCSSAVSPVILLSTSSLLVHSPPLIQEVKHHGQGALDIAPSNNTTSESRLISSQAPDEPREPPNAQPVPVLVIQECFCFLVIQNKALVQKIAGLRRGHPKGLKWVMWHWDLQIKEAHVSNVIHNGVTRSF